MNHPSNEHWMSYLYEELSPAARREADAHLQGCPECRQRMDQWRGTMGLLDADHATLALPRRGQLAAAWQPVLRWALAASVVLVTGFLAGRATGPDQADLEKQVAAAKEQLSTELRARYQDDLKAIAAATVTTTTEQNKAFLTEFNRQFNDARSQERRDWLAALDAINERHTTEMASLRQGLNILARETGTGFRQAESQLNLLAAYLPTDSGTPLTPNSIQEK
jgi:hypothetical protein